MKTFKCCHCGEHKTESFFYKDKQKKSGCKPRCKVCEKLYKDYERIRKYEKNYREKNSEKRRAILRKYYSNNKESHKQTQQTYRKTDRYKILHRKDSLLRRIRFKKTFVEVVNFLDVYNEISGKCFYCGKELSFKEAEFDHYIPIGKGGLHKKDNIRCSCPTCNRRKGAILPEGVQHQVV